MKLLQIEHKKINYFSEIANFLKNKDNLDNKINSHKQKKPIR
jgi:hypothetical protein